MTLPAPYFEDREHGITLYCGDCREILPLLPEKSIDLVLTDPPYPSYLQEEYHYHNGIIEPLRDMKMRQFIFWTPSQPFQLDYSGMRVWDKAVGTNTQFELIYERNFSSGYKIHRFMTPHNRVRAQICRDIYTEHPSQKPIQLIRLLISESGCTNTVLDPFCGSGTTLVAAKQLGRKAIGIEISEKYCQIAVDRLRQMELFTNKEGNK